jgi:hypothetical protein
LHAQFCGKRNVGRVALGRLLRTVVVIEAPVAAAPAVVQAMLSASDDCAVASTRNAGRLVAPGAVQNRQATILLFF